MVDQRQFHPDGDAAMAGIGIGGLAHGGQLSRTPDNPQPGGHLRRARWRRRCAYCRSRDCDGSCPQYQAVREAELHWDEARAAARRAAAVPPELIDGTECGPDTPCSVDPRPAAPPP